MQKILLLFLVLACRLAAFREEEHSDCSAERADAEESSLLQLEKLRVDLAATTVPSGVQPYPEPIVDTTLQFLLVSSPSEKKIVYTPLTDTGEAGNAVALPLVTSGLCEPVGLAIDNRKGYLYVADRGLKSIFRFTLYVDVTSVPANNPPGSTKGLPRLTIPGGRVVVCQNTSAEWVAVDDYSNLFYTDPETNNINKIPNETLVQIYDGYVQPEALEIVSYKEVWYEKNKYMENAAAYNESVLDNTTTEDLPTDFPDITPVWERPVILTMYESTRNSKVADPASIWVEGPDLYWVNGKDGYSAGTVVKGETDPHVTAGPDGRPLAFPAQIVTNVSTMAYAFAKTNDSYFFSRNGSDPYTGSVTGFPIDDHDIMMNFTTQLENPRGLAWDGDETMYVADEYTGNVMGFPIGRLVKDAPLRKCVHVGGAYGLVLFSANTTAFQNNQITTSGTAINDT